MSIIPGFPGSGGFILRVKTSLFLPGIPSRVDERELTVVPLTNMRAQYRTHRVYREACTPRDTHRGGMYTRIYPPRDTHQGGIPGYTPGYTPREAYRAIPTMVYTQGGMPAYTPQLYTHREACRHIHHCCTHREAMRRIELSILLQRG